MKSVKIVLERFDGLVNVDLRCAVGVLSQFPETRQLSGRLRENGVNSWSNQHNETPFFEGWPSGKVNPLRAEFETALTRDADLAYSFRKILDDLNY